MSKKKQQPSEAANDILGELIEYRLQTSDKWYGVVAPLDFFLIQCEGKKEELTQHCMKMTWNKNCRLLHHHTVEVKSPKAIPVVVGVL